MFSDEYLFTVVVWTAVVYLFYLIYSDRYKTFSYWKDRGVPYLQPDWLFGNIRNELLKRSTWPEFSRKCYNTFKENGFGGVYIFSKPVLIVCDPNLIEKILTTNFTSFHDRNVNRFDEPMMKTLFNAYGEPWRVMRSKMIPSFSSSKVKGMFVQIMKCCDFTIDQIEDEIVLSKPVDVGSLIFVYSTEVIASCAFGIQLLSNNDQREKFKIAINNVFGFSIYRAFRTVLASVFPKLLTFLGVKLVYRSVSDFFINLTKETIRFRKQNNVKRNDFLNLLIELKVQEEKETLSYDTYSMHQEDKVSAPLDINIDHKGKIFTDDRIAALVFNFITGGLKPAVSTISLALLEVARDPEIQKKLFEEIEFIIRKHKGWSYEAVRNMEYLDKVVLETLRIYSLSTVLVRTATEPCTLPGTTLKLEKDQLIYIPINPLHMDPQHHTSPTTFNPDRFLDGSYKPTPSFMPFGNGPRICIAMKFATMMMKVCLARVLFDYSVKVGGKTRLPLTFVKDEVFPKPVGGVWLIFSKRKETAELNNSCV